MNRADDPKWLAYLYRQHNRAELTEWTQAMRFFRYCRAVGGHANDGDQLLAALRCENAADLARLLAALGLEQPGHVQVASTKVFIYWHQHLQKLELCLFGAAGDPYEVSRADVDNALRIEPLLEPLVADIVMPPRAGEWCFAVPT